MSSSQSAAGFVSGAIFIAMNGKTTYILGAGASVHAGYPLASEMGRGLLNWMKASKEQVYFDYPYNANYLESCFGDNIENIVNGIQRSLRRREADFTMMVNFYEPSLRQAIREWFTEIHQQHTAESYEKFATRIVRSGDCVITMNYDLSLDACLKATGKWTLGDGYGFQIESFPLDSPVRLLKLHGSVNWLAVLFAGMTGGPFELPSTGPLGRRPAIPDDGLWELGYEGNVDPLWPRTGAAAVPPMIMPTKLKRFYFGTNLGREWSAFWNRLWRAARDAVRTSDRVVVCGYGMFPVDRRACNLLMTGEVRGEIEVCSGSNTDRIVADLRARGRQAQPAKQRRFEDWVGLLC
jgi:hypothetical protein